MERWTIGEAAARFGLAPSALRHYEELGLLTPVSRTGGKRCYDRVQMRRLAFVCTARDLGLPLAATREVLDGDEYRWREQVTEQLAELAAQAERIRRAQQVLGHALECPTAHPITECRYLISDLDSAVDGRRPE